VPDEDIILRGRVVEISDQTAVLADETGRIVCNGGAVVDAPPAWGDIVELRGRLGSEQVFVADAIRVLSQSVRDFRDGDWSRYHALERSLIKNLRLRAEVLAAIRSFFAQRGFMEVETPYMLEAPGQEVHIDAFETAYRMSTARRRLYLATSPEHHMKRMLGAGLERIYQIARCFRNGECTNLHNPEFTMVEWYRAYASYEDIMVDTEELITSVISDVCGTNYPRSLSGVIAGKPWPQITVYDAFLEWADIDLKQCADAETFLRRAREIGFASADKEDSWDDLFHKVLLEKVEPELAKFAAVFLLDYPAPLGALAKLKDANRAVAERVEVYMGGVELANGYTELNDPYEQRQRFVEARKKGEVDEPLDEDFLRAMECAMPPAGGMALGVDRLIMLLAGSEKIEEVLAFPYRP
jgi:lysyl-tRNA synthetase class 2